MASFETASFHAQQAAEKCLKALLVRYQVEFGKTHNLGELLRLADGIVPGISAQLPEVRELTLYAVDARYPGESPPVDRHAARRHAAIARKALEAVRSLLKEYLDAGRPGR